MHVQTLESFVHLNRKQKKNKNKKDGKKKINNLRKFIIFKHFCFVDFQINYKVIPTNHKIKKKKTKKKYIYIQVYLALFLCIEEISLSRLRENEKKKNILKDNNNLYTYKFTATRNDLGGRCKKNPDISNM